MFVCALLFTSLLGLLGTSAGLHCRPFVQKEIETIRSRIQENKKCPCEATFMIDGDYNQTECKCFEVPKIQENCNLTCFVKGFEKLKYLKMTNKFIDQFPTKHVHHCTADMFSCFRPCDDMENVTASAFLDSVANIMQQMTNQLMNNRIKNNRLKNSQ